MARSSGRKNHNCRSDLTKLRNQNQRGFPIIPEEDQDTLAEMLLNDLASEERWTEAFAKSQDEFSLLAKEALTEFKQGKTN